ncbi:heat shock protein Hsp20 [Methyloglobulus morosus KoM1]|uniref:Heat shock protein Hsp20 n=1 Tax=Methyloglobulus morosus KoM1 TaxID=1116472 RepID=V5BYF4_9GAMM|nr:Hsp20/alpha crystallin family protein [Methyloglobulus morosus]ESS71277.1 heat shock protein Hsp20 [Methyloglobulus morosus KoM1]
MNDKDKKKEMTPTPSTGGLISFDEFDSFFDDFLLRRWPRVFDWNLPAMGTLEKSFPKVDIIDHENEIEVQAALPGVKKEDLDVTINNQAITIRTSRKEEKKEEGKYFRREITRGEYQRTLSLPDYVDSDNAKASFKDGILKVAIPKADKGKRKSVEIKG